MWTIRTSLPGDIPAQQELWQLAFGDEQAYIDNFYRTYYRPERVLVLEEAGEVRSMTAWFDTVFSVPGQGEYRAAYLYAVATHPQCRGRGMSGAVLSWADDYFRALGVHAVTTVPASPSLHRFFAANGFRECFTLHSRAYTAGNGGGLPLRPVQPQEYAAVRAERLAGTAHIAYPEQALIFQQGCCVVDGGGLYAGQTEYGPFCLCAEGVGRGSPVCKELLCPPGWEEKILPALGRLDPGAHWELRTPQGRGEGEKFAMLKWLEEKNEEKWDWKRTAYLGLAFD